MADQHPSLDSGKSAMQSSLFTAYGRALVRPFRLQLLKWVGNKQRFAHRIASYFPARFGTYYEPFLGSGAVLGTLAPPKALGSDCFGPLMEIWLTLRNSPARLKRWYGKRWRLVMAQESRKQEEYERIKASYNRNPNGADLLFLCRACYGGVVRFRQQDGHMSTPCGVHTPVSADSFSERVDEWRRRTRGTTFRHCDYHEAMDDARAGDLVYCDPPYSNSQAILYGAQSFSLEAMFKAVEKCKTRGVCVAVSIDGKKRSGEHLCDVPIPQGLFEREIFIDCGRSMLKRFQMGGETLESEVVADRLLLTY